MFRNMFSRLFGDRQPEPGIGARSALLAPEALLSNLPFTVSLIESSDAVRQLHAGRTHDFDVDSPRMRRLGRHRPAYRRGQVLFVIEVLYDDTWYCVDERYVSSVDERRIEDMVSRLQRYELVLTGAGMHTLVVPRRTLLQVSMGD